ncbi:hypothetical protein G1C97_0485 [Bifidobacterium sp. DSM 109959]|uniref:Uncharacterized protein n=2 Tax=Bifidobacterium olomucense TaxID=2675324 RepID=A0A7Y0EW61_9BIFI|nr:hypothetical protein [Bifidobacterium sp. DSM 109959]
MRAHLVNGVGPGYAECRARERSCPYGAEAHREFENGLAMLQFNVVSEEGGFDLAEGMDPDRPGSALDWDNYRRLAELRDLGHALPDDEYASLVGAVAAAAAGDGDRALVGGVDWTDPSAALEKLGDRSTRRLVEATARSLNLDPDAYSELPGEMLIEDMHDAVRATGVRDGSPASTPGGVKQRSVDGIMGAIDVLRGTDGGITLPGSGTPLSGSALLAFARIRGDEELATEVSNRIMQENRMLLGDEESALPSEAVRAFDKRVRAAARRELPACAKELADTLAVLHGAVINSWPESQEGYRRSAERLRGDVDGFRGKLAEAAGNGDALRLAELDKESEDLMDRLMEASPYQGDDDEAQQEPYLSYRNAIDWVWYEQMKLGTLTRLAHGLRGYYGGPVPGTEPITGPGTDDGEALGRLRMAPAMPDHMVNATSEAGNWPDEQTMFEDRDIRFLAGGAARTNLPPGSTEVAGGVTALRPDGTIEPDARRANLLAMTRMANHPEWREVETRAGGTLYKANPRDMMKARLDDLQYPDDEDKATQLRAILQLLL